MSRLRQDLVCFQVQWPETARDVGPQWPPSTCLLWTLPRCHISKSLVRQDIHLTLVRFVQDVLKSLYFYTHNLTGDGLIETIMKIMFYIFTLYFAG